MGWFEVGSGIVLVFEAPREWRLTDDALMPGRSFKLGDRLSQADIGTHSDKHEVPDPGWRAGY